jgi:ATP-binding cassette, subfamily C (CFTR/MRP), member 1
VAFIQTQCTPAHAENQHVAFVGKIGACVRLYYCVVPHFLTERPTQVILGFILSISLVNLGIAIIYPHYFYFFPLLVIEAVAFLVLPLLTYLSHTRTRRSSTVALLFWLAYFPALLIWTRTQTTLLDIAHNGRPVFHMLRWSMGGLGFIAFALECLGPEFRAEPDDKPRSNPESPLLTANIFSVWTFGWLTPLMKKGARQFIIEDDLPELVPGDEAANLGEKLQRNMKK